MDQLTPHGTYTRYANRHDPCRCTPCREANARYHRAYRLLSLAPLRAVRRYRLKQAQQYLDIPQRALRAIS